MGAGGVLPTLRRQFNDMSRSPVMAGDFTSANDRKFHMFHTAIHRKEQLIGWRWRRQSSVDIILDFVLLIVHRNLPRNQKELHHLVHCCRDLQICQLRLLMTLLCCGPSTTRMTSLKVVSCHKIGSLSRSRVLTVVHPSS